MAGGGEGGREGGNDWPLVGRGHWKEEHPLEKTIDAASQGCLGACQMRGRVRSQALFVRGEIKSGRTEEHSMSA